MHILLETDLDSAESSLEHLYFLFKNNSLLISLYGLAHCPVVEWNFALLVIYLLVLQSLQGFSGIQLHSRITILSILCAAKHPQIIKALSNDLKLGRVWYILSNLLIFGDYPPKCGFSNLPMHFLLETELDSVASLFYILLLLFYIYIYIWIYYFINLQLYLYYPF